ncbi:hypothetical protein BXZ70DRAFT_320897 [Cristinia sonorae]|uniref:Uncharacterized protein n=1 Tax=Cristinia sonorae TaxID=1940300 RepID=A0A8K0XP14_9AGAR|nr:hypothetical protein BXZ70DRAFT_320897 [Cristinia sonorae]
MRPFRTSRHPAMPMMSTSIRGTDTVSLPTIYSPRSPLVKSPPTLLRTPITPEFYHPTQYPSCSSVVPPNPPSAGPAAVQSCRPPPRSKSNSALFLWKKLGLAATSSTALSGSFPLLPLPSLLLPPLPPTIKSSSCLPKSHTNWRQNSSL